MLRKHLTIVSLLQYSESDDLTSDWGEKRAMMCLWGKWGREWMYGSVDGWYYDYFRFFFVYFLVLHVVIQRFEIILLIDANFIETALTMIIQIHT